MMEQDTITWTERGPLGQGVSPNGGMGKGSSPRLRTGFRMHSAAMCRVEANRLSERACREQAKADARKGRRHLKYRP